MPFSQKQILYVKTVIFNPSSPKDGYLGATPEILDDYYSEFSKKFIGTVEVLQGAVCTGFVEIESQEALKDVARSIEFIFKFMNRWESKWSKAPTKVSAILEFAGAQRWQPGPDNAYHSVFHIGQKINFCISLANSLHLLEPNSALIGENAYGVIKETKILDTLSLNLSLLERPIEIEKGNAYLMRQAS
ncbi:MAG: YjbD family protein [bacterium]|nr:YjbD family protein [bacterium]